MVRHHDPQLPGPGLAQALGDAGDLSGRDLAVLAAPGRGRVHADGQQAVVLEHGLQHGAQGPLVVTVGVERAREDVEQGNVMVTRHGQDRQRQALDEFARGGELAAPGALRDVAAEDDQLGSERASQVQRGLDHGFAFGAEVRVGKVQNARH
ncbi:hypothetical protein D9M68_809900 [compost metagenome]